MGWWYTAIAGVFVLGVLLAFPVAIGVCAALGGVLMTVDRLYYPMPWLLSSPVNVTFFAPLFVTPIF
jgi:hypothetical protein